MHNSHDSSANEAFLASQVPSLPDESSSGRAYPLGALFGACRDIADAFSFVLFTALVTGRLCYLLFMGRLDPTVSPFRLLRSLMRNHPDLPRPTRQA